jgi:hypothetical protein
MPIFLNPYDTMIILTTITDTNKYIVPHILIPSSFLSASLLPLRLRVESFRSLWFNGLL